MTRQGSAIERGGNSKGHNDDLGIRKGREDEEEEENAEAFSRLIRV